LLGVGGAREVGLDVVGDGGVLAAADVLADVRDSLLDATRDVVATVGHAADDRGEVYFAVLRVLAGTTCNEISIKKDLISFLPGSRVLSYNKKKKCV
jgi:hypothetical protein